MLSTNSALSYFDKTEMKSAWKLGGTNVRSQKQFGNTFPLFGAIPMKSVYLSGESIPFSANTCIELEVAVRIPHNDKDNLEFALCFELPQKRLFTNEFDLDKVLLDGCGANALVVQEHFQKCDLAKLQQSVFKMSKGPLEMEANNMENLTATPSQLLIDFLYVAVDHGFRPLPGEIVAIGGLGQCFPTSSGESYVAENKVLGHLGVTVI